MGRNSLIKSLEQTVADTYNHGFYSDVEYEIIGVLETLIENLENVEETS